MIRNLNNISFLFLTSKERSIITKELIIRPDTLNILIITALSFYLIKLINFKRIDKNEKSNELILTLNILIVGVAIICNCPYKFLIFIEIRIFPLVFYISKTAKNEDKKEALMFIIFINILGSIPFIIYSYLKRNEIKTFYTETKANSLTITLFSIILFAAKTPVFFFHFWLTKAHVRASGCCSIILARVIIKLGTMGLYKFYKSEIAIILIKYIATYRTVSSFLLRVIIIRFFDFKTLIATSSILHMCMILPLLRLYTRLSAIACIIIITSHGLISCFLFYLITIIYEKKENRSLNIIRRIESRSKLITTIILVILLLNIGLPPIINFISETLFVGAIVYIKIKLNTTLICFTLIAAILFTIQAMGILSMKKDMTIKKKREDIRSFINFRFYLPWVAILIIYL